MIYLQRRVVGDDLKADDKTSIMKTSIMKNVINEPFHNKMLKSLSSVTAEKANQKPTNFVKYFNI